MPTTAEPPTKRKRANNSIRWTLHEVLKVDYLTENTLGNDYIVGDLHGHYNALQVLLRAITFSTRVDRLLSVGDLVDRGDENYQCLGLLSKPWFHSVLGNHDIALAVNSQRLSCNPDDAHYYNRILRQNTQWWKQGDTRLRKAARLFNKRPHIMVIGSGASRFHVVHSCLHPMQAAQLLATDSWIDTKLAHTGHNPDIVYHTTSNRDLWRYGIPDTAPDFSPTFCGHTPLTSTVKAAGHVGIDLGSGHRDKLGFSARLAIINPKLKVGWAVSTNLLKDGRPDPARVEKFWF